MILLIDLSLVLVLLLLRMFVGFPVWVKGSSMYPTLKNRQLLWVWRTRRFQRGDIVICHFPGRYQGKHKLIPQLFVKRLIGLPGETVSLRAGQLSINEEALEETYLPLKHFRVSPLARSWSLTENQLFVMGDNRSASHDCRQIGPLDRDLVVGRVGAVLFPFSAAHRFRTPDYPVLSLPSPEAPENMTISPDIVSNC